MTTYKCGHKSKDIFTGNLVFLMPVWKKWRETVGYKGDSSQCFDCYIARNQIKEHEDIITWYLNH